MTEHLQTVFNTIAQLTPDEQLELIATVSLSLQKQLQPRRIRLSIQEFAPSDIIPAGVRRTPPLQKISQLKAGFWPEDETADDINNYLEQQRKEDLLREQGGDGAADTNILL